MKTKFILFITCFSVSFQMIFIKVEKVSFLGQQKACFGSSSLRIKCEMLVFQFCQVCSYKAQQDCVNVTWEWVKFVTRLSEIHVCTLYSV